MKRLFPFFLFPFLLSTLAAQDSIARAEAWPIVVAVHDTLAALHPAAFLEDGRTRLNAELENIRPRLDDLLTGRPGDSLTYPEVIGLAAPLSDVLGCGHTFLRRRRTKALTARLNANKPVIHVLPVIGEGFLLVKDVALGAGDTLREGTRIRAVDGRPVGEVVDELTRFYGINDHGHPAAAQRLIALNLDYQIRKNYGPRDTIRLTVVEDGTERTRTVPLPKVEKEPKTGKKKKTKKPRSKGLEVTFNEDRTVAYLEVSSFADRNYRKVNYKKEVRKAIDAVNEADVDKLIVDVRSNLGGSIFNTIYLLRALALEPFAATESMESYSPIGRPKNFFAGFARSILFGQRRDGDHVYRKGLAKAFKPFPEKRRFTGDLAVLINSATFSAGTLFAHQVKVAGRGILVGDTSSGSARRTFGGGAKRYRIGTEGQLQLSFMNFAINMYKPAEANLEPTHPYVLTLEHMLTEKDDARAYAEKLLLGK